MAGPNRPFDALLGLPACGLDFDPDQCVRVRHRRSSCTACADACPAALAFDGNRFALDPARCGACGACAVACPTGAIRRPGRTAEVVRGEGTTVLVTCRSRGPRSDESAPGVRLACLGDLTVSDLVACAVRGAEHVVVAVPDCMACSRRAPRAAVSETCDRARDVLRMWSVQIGIEVCDEMAPPLCPPDPPVCGPGIDPASFRYAKAGPGAALAQRVPPDRAELLDALDALAEARGGGGAACDSGVHAGAVWLGVSIDRDACCSCRRCAAFCPTGALRSFHTRQGDVGVKQQAALCVACRLCEDACPRGALRLVDDVARREVDARAVRRFVLPRPRFGQGPHAMVEAMKAYVADGRVSDLV